MMLARFPVADDDSDTSAVLSGHRLEDKGNQKCFISRNLAMDFQVFVESRIRHDSEPTVFFTTHNH